MNPEQSAPITKETAGRRLKNFAGVVGSIFGDEKKGMAGALDLIYTIAEQQTVLPSPDGHACTFLSDDETIRGDFTITPNKPYEMSLTSAHKPGLALIAVFQVDLDAKSLAAAIRIIRSGKPIIQYFSGNPSEANPQSILLEMFRRNRQTA